MKKITKISASVAAYLATAGSAFAAFTVQPVDAAKVTPFPDLGALIGQVLVLIIILSSILLFIYLVIGGLQWLTSGGDKMAAQAARDKITAALTGLVIVLAAFALVRILEAAFGIRVLSGINVPTVPSPF